jgi:esterase/lipase superfamily enzyme
LKRAYRESQGQVYKLATLYASDADKALQISSKIHRGPRAGSAGNDILVIENIETIDASSLSSIFGLNHSYVFEDTRAIRDLGSAVVDQFPASARRQGCPGNDSL